MRMSAEQMPGDGLEILAVVGQKFIAQRRRHADAAIRGRAAAEADEDLLRAALDGMPDELARAVSIGAQAARVPPFSAATARTPRSSR